MIRIFLFSILFSAVLPVQAQPYQLEQLLQRFVDNYNGFDAIELKQQQQLLEEIKLQNQYDWSISGQSAYTHDRSGLGLPSDQLNLSGKLNRALQSGDNYGLQASYRFEESETALIPSLPNPSHNTNLDLYYSRPLLQGAGNPAFAEGVKQSRIASDMTELSRQQLRDQMAQLLIDMFYGLAFTQQRIANAEQSIERTRRLLRFIEKNYELGLSEDKDILQTKAQLQSREVERVALNQQLVNQIYQLARLVGEEDIQARAAELDAKALTIQLDDIIQRAQTYDPQLRMRDKQIEIADSKISILRDQKRDVLNASASVGMRSATGENAFGEVSEQDFAAKISLEYRYMLNKKSVSTGIEQAEMDKTIALKEKQKIQMDLLYTLKRLGAETETIHANIVANQLRLKAEQDKYQEAEKRYRNGRATTFELIQFETEVRVAELQLIQQQLELQKKLDTLKLLQGLFWNKTAIAQRQ